MFDYFDFGHIRKTPWRSKLQGGQQTSLRLARIPDLAR
jgi:hypothetical protein